MTELIKDFENLTINKVIDNKVIDNEIIDNKIVNNKVIDNEIIDNKIINNKVINKKNKGVGAGGKETNIKGKKFEDLTININHLFKNGYIKIKLNKNKFGYFLKKNINEKDEIYFFLQSGLKIYLKNNFNINLFRNPDEAYIIKKYDGSYILKIIEKKEQSVEGSVETKLWRITQKAT
jgi:hypothetical protein